MTSLPNAATEAAARTVSGARVSRAETLREAARRMRMAALATSTGEADWYDDCEALGRILGESFGPDAPDADAVFIASWRPAVALAVADWLDATASRCEDQGNHGWRGSRHALAVARAYLGGES